MSVVIIDNYDSFTYNIAHCVAGAGYGFIVLPNRTALHEIEACQPTHLILSAGPGDVADSTSYGVCAAALARFAGTVPVLGICLGHQLIASHYGASVRRSAVVRHGWLSTIRKIGPSAIFDGLGDSLVGTRYHSLVVAPETLPPSLRVTGVSVEDGEIMALEHREYSVIGVQFHPESIGTVDGPAMLRSFLRLSTRMEEPCPQS